MTLELVPQTPSLPDENIIRLTDFIQKKPRQRKECMHDHLVVDEANRRIDCSDCGREIDPFEAVLIWADKTSNYQARYDAMRKDHKGLAEYVPHLRAVRELESMWRGNMLPCCPHCKRGVTPDGLLSTGAVHKSFAAALLKAEVNES